MPPVQHSYCFFDRWDGQTLTNGLLVLVEYDGDDHYRDSLKIKTDRERDTLAQQNQMRVVRVPYWIQLDSTTVQYYFGISAAIIQTFPHGFITTKLFPASFCELGIERFRSDLHALPVQVRGAVIKSLRGYVARAGRGIWVGGVGVRIAHYAEGVGHRPGSLNSAIATSRIRLWLFSGWGCRGRRLSRG
jgi:hypothetical protein